MVNIRIEIDDVIYEQLHEISSNYFKGITIDGVIEAALVETFFDLKMFENNPRLSAKRYAESMLVRVGKYIKAQEAKHNE